MVIMVTMVIEILPGDTGCQVGDIDYRYGDRWAQDECTTCICMRYDGVKKVSNNHCFLFNVACTNVRDSAHVVANPSHSIRL